MSDAAIQMMKLAVEYVSAGYTPLGASKRFRDVLENELEYDDYKAILKALENTEADVDWLTKAFSVLCQLAEITKIVPEDFDEYMSTVQYWWLDYAATRVPDNDLFDSSHVSNAPVRWGTKQAKEELSRRGYERSTDWVARWKEGVVEDISFDKDKEKRIVQLTDGSEIVLPGESFFTRSISVLLDYVDEHGLADYVEVASARVRYRTEMSIAQARKYYVPKDEEE